MNRLVLIGNGFDLAHGLNTSYKHFICWYFYQWGKRLLHGLGKEESDGLCTFKIHESINVPNWASAFKGWYYQKENPLVPWDANEVFFKAIKDRNLCDFSFTSPLLQRIWKQLLLGWVDIENEYYSLLIEKNMSIGKGIALPDFNELNRHLDILRDYLIQYLQTENEKKTPTINEIKEKIYRPILKKELAIASNSYYDYRTDDENPLASILLLNFNYTKTPELYVEKNEDLDVRINYIHGQLESPKSVIFGYGDELDESYQRLRNNKDNECLRHIKSIRYLELDNYRKMLEFINSAPFQICIMGHSCGVSDRTLLNTLFEHKNCISIKPYYYKKEDGTDNYLELVQNISRNFTDMKLMRDRVVNKTYCEPLVK